MLQPLITSEMQTIVETMVGTAGQAMKTSMGQGAALGARPPGFGARLMTLSQTEERVGGVLDLR